MVVHLYQNVAVEEARDDNSGVLAAAEREDKDLVLISERRGTVLVFFLLIFGDYLSFVLKCFGLP